VPLNAYGVLKGTVLDHRAATAGGSGHHHLLCGADDGAWQNGGLLVRAGGTWTAILLRFPSQAWTTDPAGHVLR
jgi:hypothetical protein